MAWIVKARVGDLFIGKVIRWMSTPYNILDYYHSTALVVPEYI
jgi:hypothetical protein